MMPVITLLLLASCSDDFAGKEEPEGTKAPVAEQPLGISVGVATRSIAMTGATFPHESKINVILADPLGGGTTAYGKSMVYTFKKPDSNVAGTWLTTTEFLVGEKTANVLAHYPATLPAGATLSADKRSISPGLEGTMDFGKLENYNGDNIFRMKLSTDPGAMDSEILIANGEVDYISGAGNDVYADPKVPTAHQTTITMHHALCMIVLRMYKAPESITPGYMSKFTFANATMGGPLKKGSFALADQSFTPLAPAEDMTYVRTLSGFPAGLYFATFVYPATFGNKEVELTLQIDGGSYTFELPAGKWEAGKVVFYEVRINGQASDLKEEILVKDWPADVIDHDFELS